jgi:glycosyltransferase involved in cell wall biosynthesis
MRILTFLHSFEPGGVERVALRLVRHWRGQGVDAPLFMGRTDGAMRDELVQGLDHDGPRRPSLPVDWCETLWMIATLPGAIRRLRPDVLFCAGNSYAVVAIAMKLLLGRRCPPIVAKISNDLERRDMPWAGRFCYRLWLRVQGRFIDRFVAMAPGLEREIARLIRPRASAAIIADPALTLAQIDRLPEPQAQGDGRHYVAVGRLARQKNFQLMLDAFARGAGPLDRLTIYGDGPEWPALQKQAARLGIAGQLCLPGHVPDPASLIGRHDVFLLSSDFEGVPAVILEALAAGLPIVATRCSAAMDGLLLQGMLGRLVEPGDHAGFAEALANPRPQDRAAARTLARRFTLEAASPAYLDTFAAALGRAAPSPVTADKMSLI